jgi:hypothetical protein
MNVGLPEHYKIVAATAGSVTTNGGVTFDTVSLKNVHKAYIVAMFLQAVSHATTIQPVVGTGVASCATSITFSAKWWKNADISASDTLVAQTAATSMACTAGATNQLLVVEIDPALVTTQSNTYTALGATIATSSQGSDYVTAWYLLEERYPQATPPAAITD